MRVNEVEDLGQTISTVLRGDLQGWDHPVPPNDKPAKPTKAQRAEIYRWLLGLKFGDRMIRYGCDRDLDRLDKKARVSPAQRP